MKSSRPDVFAACEDPAGHQQLHPPTNPMNDLILYTTEDGRSQIKLRARNRPSG